MVEADTGGSARNTPPPQANGKATPDTDANSLTPGFALRLAMFFTALFLVAGAKLPYLPLWLDWRGLGTAEIAAVASAPLFVRIVAGPLIAMVADWWGDRRQAAVLLASISLAALSLLYFAHGFWPILFVTLLAALATTGLMPIAETLAMGGVRRGGLDYGRMRLWGSVSFIAAGFAAGAAIGWYGPGALLGLLIVAAVFTLAVALALPADPDAQNAGSPPRRLDLASLGRMVMAPRFLVFLLAAGAVQSSHAVFYTFGVLDWQRQGISPTLAAACWSVGVVAEIGLFAFSRTVVERVGAPGLIVAGGLAGLLRWTIMAFEPPLALLMPLQALHGLTFGAAHLGALHFLGASVAPSEAGTAQAVYASVTAGIGMGLATLFAGPLYGSFGSRAYLAMALLATIGILAAIWLRWSSPGRSIPVNRA
jgi:PPP family 3-phenylpropionic acid transporter